MTSLQLIIREDEWFNKVTETLRNANLSFSQTEERIHSYYPDQNDPYWFEHWAEETITDPEDPLMMAWPKGLFELEIWTRCTLTYEYLRSRPVTQARLKEKYGYPWPTEKTYALIPSAGSKSFWSPKEEDGHQATIGAVVNLALPWVHFGLNLPMVLKAIERISKNPSYRDRKVVDMFNAAKETIRPALLQKYAHIQLYDDTNLQGTIEEASLIFRRNRIVARKKGIAGAKSQWELTETFLWSPDAIQSFDPNNVPRHPTKQFMGKRTISKAFEGKSLVRKRSRDGSQKRKTSVTRHHPSPVVCNTTKSTFDNEPARPAQCVHEDEEHVEHEERGMIINQVVKQTFDERATAPNVHEEEETVDDLEGKIAIDNSATCRNQHINSTTQEDVVDDDDIIEVSTTQAEDVVDDDDIMEVSTTQEDVVDDDDIIEVPVVEHGSSPRQGKPHAQDTGKRTPAVMLVDVEAAKPTLDKPCVHEEDDTMEHKEHEAIDSPVSFQNDNSSSTMQDDAKDDEDMIDDIVRVIVVDPSTPPGSCELQVQDAGDRTRVGTESVIPVLDELTTAPCMHEEEETTENYDQETIGNRVPFQNENGTSLEADVAMLLHDQVDNDVQNMRDDPVMTNENASDPLVVTNSCDELEKVFMTKLRSTVSSMNEFRVRIIESLPCRTLDEVKRYARSVISELESLIPVVDAKSRLQKNRSFLTDLLFLRKFLESVRYAEG